jgi:hypothetical protein
VVARARGLELEDLRNPQVERRARVTDLLQDDWLTDAGLEEGDDVVEADGGRGGGGGRGEE